VLAVAGDGTPADVERHGVWRACLQVVDGGAKAGALR
jgi:hypothetical protein